VYGTRYAEVVTPYEDLFVAIRNRLGQSAAGQTQYDLNPNGTIDLLDLLAARAAPTVAPIPAVQPYAFQGRRRNVHVPTTGQPLVLYDFRAREYDPLLGRFHQRDPAEYLDAYNLYLALGGNPIVGFDPTGTFTLLDTKAAISIGMSLYSMTDTFFTLKRAVENFANGVSMRSIMLELAIDIVAGKVGGAALDTLVDFAAPIIKSYSKNFGKGLRRAPPVSKQKVAKKPDQNHHVVAQGEKAFRDSYDEVLNKYDLSIDDEWNIVVMPHQGRHPKAYYMWVAEKLALADRIAQGNKKVFEDFMKELAEYVKKHPELLTKEYWP
jgi:RHS repeat-associated protein